VACIGLTVALSGCASHRSVGQGNSLVVSTMFVSPSQANKEYLHEEKKLPPLPKGDNYPIPSYPSRQHGDRVTYGFGMGYNGADFRWICEWEGKLLTDDPSSPQYQSDLHSLDKLRDFFVYQQPGSDEREYVTPLLERAQRGDPSGLAVDFSENCKGGASP
jgi:hypothetical protein